MTINALFRKEALDFCLYGKDEHGKETEWSSYRRPEVKPHPSLSIDGYFLEDMKGGRLFEKVQYEEVEAEYYGVRPQRSLKKLVAIITFREDEAMIPKQTLVIEGEEPWQNWFDKVHGIRLSPDGTKVAAIVTIGGKQTVVVNDQLWSTAFEESFYWEYPHFSPDSHRVAVSVVRDGSVVIIVDDVPWEDLVCRLPRERASEGVCYPAHDSFITGVVNKKFFLPQFGPNGVCVAVLTTSIRHDWKAKEYEAEWTVAVEGRPWPRSFHGVEGFWLKFSDDGQHIAVPVEIKPWSWSSPEENRWTLAVDGEPWSLLVNSVSDIRFLPNGSVAARVFARFKNPEKPENQYPDEYSGVAIGGEPISWTKQSFLSFEYDVRTSRFSQKFTVYGYILKKGKKHLVMKKKFPL